MVRPINTRAKGMAFVFLLCIILHSFCNGTTIKTTPLRDTLSSVFRSYIGVKEASGHNDGKQVNEFQRATGNHTGDAWCASFVAYCLKMVGINITGNGMARSWFDKRHTVYARDKDGVKRFYELAGYRGNTAGLYFANKGAIAHILFIQDIKDDKIITVEGNTNNQLSREGNGCFQCIRKIKQIHSVSNWIDK